MDRHRTHRPRPHRHTRARTCRGLLATAIAFALFTLLSILTLPPAARACSLICGRVVVRPAGGTVPANLPGVAILGSGGAELRLVAVETGEVVAAHIVSEESMLGPTDTLVLDEPLVPGQQYELQGTICDTTRGRVPGIVASYTAGPEQALPRILGTAVSEALGRRKNRFAGGPTCSYVIEADAVAVRLQVSEDADAWSGVFVYTTHVDGAFYMDLTQAPEHNLLPPEGLAAVRIVAECADDVPWLGPGVHEVIIEGSLPGSDVVLRSDAAEIMLSCDEPQPDGCNVHSGDAGSRTAWLAFAALLLIARRTMKQRAN